MSLTFSVNVNKLEKGVVFFFFLFVFFQVSLGDFFGLSARIYYLFLPVIFALYYNRSGNYANVIFLYYSVLFLTTLVQLPFGVNPNSFWFLAISSYVCWMGGRAVALKFSSEEILRLFSFVAWVLIAFIVVRTLVTQAEIVSGFSNRFLLIDYPFIAPGGWNIELTFLSFLLILLRGKNVFWWLFWIFIFLELVFQSRVGFLLLCLLLIIKPGRALKVKDVFSLSILGGALFMMVYFLYSVSGGIGVIDRLLDFNREIDAYDSGVGRLHTFEMAYQLLENKIYGYGIGMGIEYADLLIGGLNDANFHNIYIQIFVEGGWQSLVLLLVITVSVFHGVIKGKFENRFGCVAIAYFISGLFQFNGYDTIGWLFIGLFHGSAERLRLVRLQVKA